MQIVFHLLRVRVCRSLSSRFKNLKKVCVKTQIRTSWSNITMTRYMNNIIRIRVGWYIAFIQINTMTINSCTAGICIFCFTFQLPLHIFLLFKLQNSHSWCLLLSYLQGCSACSLYLYVFQVHVIMYFIQQSTRKCTYSSSNIWESACTCLHSGGLFAGHDTTSIHDGIRIYWTG